MDLVDSEKRPQFGSRYLTNPEEVFDYNAWDDVEWDDDQEAEAKDKVKKNSSLFMTEESALEYEGKADQFWDTFYQQHNTGFFKDRNWLFTEFPDLIQWEKDETSSAFSLLEVGCGVGNTVFPILEANKYKKKMKNETYNPDRCIPFIWDITKDGVENVLPLKPDSLDVVLMIFVLSAICPTKMQSAVNNIVKFLKPGGLLLFRDYGRYDLAQLRFKNGRCVSENFYVRGDGTRVYFFTQDELHEMFTNAGLSKEVNRIDRRLQVNRLKMLKMYRIWIQCNYRKNV